MFDLNLSSSHCSTSHALEIQNMDALHDDWGSLDDFDYTSRDPISSNSHTSDSANDCQDKERKREEKERKRERDILMRQML